MKISFIKFCLLIFIFEACAPIYVPNVINAPLLSNKNELQASINTGTSGFDPQIAYAVTDNIGIMLNGSFKDSKSDSLEDYHKHQFGEIGIGYYKKLDENARFEVFTGFGYGKIKAYTEFAFLNDYVNLESYRFFIQPDIGITNKIIDASFSTRFIVFNTINNNINYNRMFLEPALTFRVGYKYIKFSVQVGYSFALSSSIINYEPFIFSIGLHAKLFRNYSNSKTVY